MLAGLFKAPGKYAPHINLPAARARANTVLDNLVEAGMMTEGQVFGARRNPANVVDRRDERSPNYYLDWAFDEVKKTVDTLPKSVHDRVFVVRTALDVNLQRHSENVVESKLREYGQEYGAKQIAVVPQAGHNDLFDRGAWEKVRGFIESLRPVPVSAPVLARGGGQVEIAAAASGEAR